MIMITILCAMKQEADGLIKELGLTCTDQSVYDVYSDDRIRLVITGIGRINAATACGYCIGKFGIDDCYINYGSAAGLHSGTYLAAMIKDASTSREYFPDTASRTFCHATLITCDSPVNEYMLLRDSFGRRPDEAPMIYDMEGAAVFNALKRSVTPDRIIIIKTVTDNGDPDFTMSRKILDSAASLVSDHIKDIASRPVPVHTDDALTDTLSNELCCSKTMYHELSQFIKYMTASGRRNELITHIDACRRQGLIPAHDRRHGKALLSQLISYINQTDY